MFDNNIPLKSNGQLVENYGGHKPQQCGWPVFILNCFSKQSHLKSAKYFGDTILK